VKPRQSRPKDRPAHQVLFNKPSKEEVVKTYLPLVRYVAEKIHRRLPPTVDQESLVHSGVVGLLEALERYDPSRGVAFEDYARYRIRGEVIQSLRSLDWVSRSVRAWGRRVSATVSRLVSRFGREPTAEELAVELNIPLDEYYRMYQKVNEANLLSLEDLSVGSEDLIEKAREDFISNPFQDPLKFVEGKGLVEKLAGAIEELPERERLVVTLYYYEELTLREIGEILGVSEGRVCQINAQAVSRLRRSLGASETEPAADAERGRKLAVGESRSAGRRKRGGVE
jgi:RNA polymerase sigma factor for flagellar operon FliA